MALFQGNDEITKAYNKNMELFFCSVFICFTAYLTLTYKDSNNEVKPIEELQVSEGILSVERPARGSRIVKLNLNNESGYECCILIPDGSYQRYRHLKEKKLRIYWQYFENLDMKFGFRVILLDDIEGEREISRYKWLKEDYKDWEEHRNDSYWYYPSMLSFFIMVMFFLIRQARSG